MNRALPALVVGVGAAVLAAACSFTTAVGLTECTSDVDCGPRAVCSQKLCLPMPQRCSVLEGPRNNEAAVRFAALLPVTLDGGAVDPRVGSMLQGMQLAVRKVNAAGGVLNRPFVLLSCDNVRSLATLAEHTDWVISQALVPAVVTSGNAQTVAVAERPSRVDAGTLVVSPDATASRLASSFAVDRAVYRLVPIVTAEATALANVLTMEPQYATGPITALALAGSDSSDLADALKARLAASTTSVRTLVIREYLSPVDGGAVAAGLPLDAGAQNLAFMGTAEEARPIVHASRGRGYRWLFSGAARSPVLLDATTSAELEASFGTSLLGADGGSAERTTFRNAFSDTKLSLPESELDAMRGFDAAFVLMSAAAFNSSTEGTLISPQLMATGIRQVSTTDSVVRVSSMDAWSKVRSALGGGRGVNLEGYSSSLDFERDAGSVVGTFERWRVVDGGIVTVP